MPKFNEYTEKTNPDDVDIFLLQDAASTRKISFLNIFNRIKTKLGLGELATKSKVAQSDLEAALANLIAGKLTSSGIANNLTTTDTTKVLAAPQGKALLESITSALTLIGSLDALTTTEKTNLVGSINELVTSLTALNSNLNASNFALTNSTYYPTTSVFVSGRVVQLQCAGLILKDVPANSEFVIGTLPAAYRPSYKIIKYVLGGSTTSRLFRISIDVDGKVTYTPTADIATGVGVNINETFIAKPS